MNIQRTPTLPDSLRRKLMFGLPGGLVFATPLAMVGCGGGGGDAAIAGPQVQGQLALPAAVKAADVTVVGNTDEVAVADDGKFTLAVADDSLTLVAAVHGSDRALHYGLVRAGLAGQTLDARSSAAALLFVSLGASQLAPADRRAVHESIAADTQTAALASVIQARIDANPFALDEPDAQIVSALKQSLQAMRARPAGALPGGRARRLAVTDVQPLLRIEPGGEVNGISVNQDGDTPGFSIVNTKRRPGIAHLYKVGYQMPEAARVDISPAEVVGQPIRIASTQALSIAAAPGAFMGGAVPWEPKTSSRVPLAMHEGAEQTIYEVVYLTPVWDAADPTIAAEPRYRLYREAWLEELGNLYERTQMEIVFGAILEALGVGGGAFNEGAFATAMANLRAVAAADGGFFTLMAQVRGGTALMGGIQGWFTTMAGATGRIATLNSLVLSAVAPMVEAANAQLAANMAARSLSRAKLTMFHGAMRVLAAVSVVGGAVDSGAQWKDLHSGEKASLFTATLVGPKVQVSPSSGKVGKGEEQTLTARVTGTQGVTLTYRWTLTGSTLANLSDRAGKVGLTIDTDKDVVVLATTPSTVGTLTITVEAFQVKSGGNRSLGEAVATLEMDNNIIKLTPEVARIERVGGDQLFSFSMTVPPVADALSYEWRCASQHGRLISGGDETSSARTSIVSAAPTARYLGRDGLDGGESETITCIAFYTPADPNTGQAVRKNIGQATAEVQVKQKFNVEIVSLPTLTPADNSVAVTAQITDPVPAGATIEWSWLHSGVGSIQTSLTDANKPHSSVQFASGAVEGLAIFTVSARVVVPGQAAVPVLPVTASTQVKKNLVQVVINAKGGSYGCTDPKACGVSAYTAFLVPRYAKAVLYRAVLSGYDYPGCNRTVTWTGVVGDRGGCNFPVTYFPHSSAGATDTWAVWIGFGGAISGKCVVTITLAP